MQELEESTYTIKTEGFEGPLEVLLNLVESKKLFINEISLGKVTDEYLSHIRSLEGLNLTEATSFLSIAATLILIKSKSLLPGFIVTKDEEKDIKDLESRLMLYSLIKSVSEEITQKYGKTVIHLPPERQLFDAVFAPDPNLKVEHLHIAIGNVIASVPKKEKLPEVKVKKIISLDVMLTQLTERIANSAKVSFKEWRNSVGGENEESVKGNVIVSFLAMLELVRQGFMDAMQDTAFEDIELVKLEEEQL